VSFLRFWPFSQYASLSVPLLLLTPFWCSLTRTCHRLNNTVPYAIGRVNLAEFVLSEDCAAYVLWLTRRTKENSCRLHEFSLRRGGSVEWRTVFEAIRYSGLSRSVRTINMTDFQPKTKNQNDLSVFKNVKSLRVSGVTSNPRITGLNQLNGLTELRLTYNAVSKPKDWLKFMNHLQVLQLKLSGVGTEPSLPGLTASARTLRKLSIEFYTVVPTKILEEATICTGLTSLKITFKKKLVAETFSVDSFATLTKLQELKTLALSGIGVGAPHLRRIASMASHITSLAIDRSPFLGKEGFQVITSQFTSLKKLSAFQSNIPSYWLALVTNLTKLKVLRIAYKSAESAPSVEYSQFVEKTNLVFKLKGDQVRDTFVVQHHEREAGIVAKMLADRRRRVLGLKQCSGCGKFELKPHDLLRCSVCRAAFYCNVSCQMRPWNMHKPKCKSAKDQTTKVVQ
jgi:hypothetical protein